MAIFEHQHHEGSVRGQTDKIDVLDGRLMLRRKHKAGAAGHAGQRRTYAIKQSRDTSFVGCQFAFDGLAILDGQIADLHQPVHEHAEAELCWLSARRNVRRIQQAEEFQVLHNIADGGRTDLFTHLPGQGARTHGVARMKIALDHAPENLARPVVHLSKKFACVRHQNNNLWGLAIKEKATSRSIGVDGFFAGHYHPANQQEDKCMRPSGRETNEMRPVVIETNVTRHAEGSCLIKCGDTHVLCTASIEERVPPWMKNSGLGWVTAEYGMLPRATHTRGRREAKSGQSGRTQEIQRLIGRSLRACIDRPALGERQILIDCDVIQADGGTRCASITGGWVALRMAVNALMKTGDVKTDPLTDHVAAVSCGIYAGQPVLDLDYPEDSEAGVDGNYVLTGAGRLIEVQMSAEGSTFSRDQMTSLLELAENGVGILVAAQKDAIG